MLEKPSIFPYINHNFFLHRRWPNPPLTFTNKIKIYCNKPVFNFHLPNSHFIPRLNSQRQLLLLTGQTSKYLSMALLPIIEKQV